MLWKSLVILVRDCLNPLADSIRLTLSRFKNCSSRIGKTCFYRKQCENCKNYVICDEPDSERVWVIVIIFGNFYCKTTKRHIFRSIENLLNCSEKDVETSPESKRISKNEKVRTIRNKLHAIVNFDL